MSSTRPNPQIISIPKRYTHLLPSPFNGSIFNSFVNGTTTSDPIVNSLLEQATTTPFISYDDEFLALLGPNPTIELIDERAENFAGEAGVWIRERNEVWYTTWINDGPTHVEILDMITKTVREFVPSPDSDQLQNPNGGFYYQGRMYFACIRDDSRGWSGGVVAIDPETCKVETILNSYFGLKFDCIDDVAWVTQQSTGDSYMFITILPFPNPIGVVDAGAATDSQESTASTMSTLPQGLWRWDPQKQVLLPAISRTEFPVANGVRPSKDQKQLWVTDFGGEERSKVWGLPAKVGAPAIYRYDLDEDMWPVNKRIFGVARMQAPDGIRIDDQGRVWTAEGEGIVVRAPDGRVLGVFNAHFFTRDPVKVAIVQFELVEDSVVILGQNKLWIVKISEVVNGR